VKRYRAVSYAQFIGSHALYRAGIIVADNRLESTADAVGRHGLAFPKSSSTVYCPAPEGEERKCAVGRELHICLATSCGLLESEWLSMSNHRNRHSIPSENRF
jgi:hypothetical protein